ncbi:MAG TPA: hypothetical protein VLK26_03565 [Rudaea sp.]|nr:hypothetical protein [Rudaea sp.]
MNRSTIISCAVASAALAVAALAQAATGAASAPSQVDLARAQQVRALMQAQTNQAKAAASKTGVAGAKPGNTKPAELYANPDRAYPPSCLGSPMPFGMWQSDPNYKHQVVNLIGDPLAGDANERNYSEAVDVYVFRVACSSGLSATLVEIDRPSTHSSNYYPTFPGIYVTQGSQQDYVVRVANDPNTFYSTNFALNPLIQSDVFVLENFYAGVVQFNFNQAITVTIDNLAASFRQIVDFPLATYNPAQYAAASQPLPISGYMTGNWYDQNHSGEGIQVEVGEFAPTDTTYPRYITIAWYTFDSSGTPYWLFGTGFFNAGDTSAVVTLGYSYGGGFAGNFGASATQKLWGTFNVQFPDCNTMQFSYQSTAGLPTGVPFGTGSKTWKRLTQMNGLTCQ